MPQDSIANDLAAIKGVIEAIQPLDMNSRLRVLSAVGALLGSTDNSTPVAPQLPADTPKPNNPLRPKSLIELMQEKNPATNAQRITLFAFFRERIQGQPRFQRTDLKSYFSHARLSPPANFDRDFNNAVESGWIHEDGDQSYITSKGLELIESGFSTAQGTTRSRPKVAKKKKSKATARKKSGRKK